MELVRTPIRGMYRDILKGPDGAQLFDSGWVPNTIVDGCHILVAEFMKRTILPDKTLSARGIQYMEVGVGNPDWDNHGEAPRPELDRLVSPYPEKIDWLKFTYLDKNDIEVAGPTDRLEISAPMAAQFPKEETCDLREFGLFASLGGNELMINVIRHPLIRKEPQMSLERVVRLYF